MGWRNKDDCAQIVLTSPVPKRLPTRDKRPGHFRERKKISFRYTKLT